MLKVNAKHNLISWKEGTRTKIETKNHLPKLVKTEKSKTYTSRKDKQATEAKAKE